MKRRACSANSILTTGSSNSARLTTNPSTSCASDKSSEMRNGCGIDFFSDSAETTAINERQIYTMLSIVVIACYANGLPGDFVHDDIPAITINNDVLGINAISYVFQNDFWGTPMADVNSHKSYRPLTILSFR